MKKEKIYYVNRGDDYLILHEWKYGMIEDHIIKKDNKEPKKIKYIIFYEIFKDPIIFCQTLKEVKHQITVLTSRPEVSNIKAYKFFKKEKNCFGDNQLLFNEVGKKTHFKQ